MQSIVLYVSQVGSTKKYAEDIAKTISAEVMPLKKFKWKNLSNYNLIIFGGWVMGGKIKGLDDFLSHYDDMSDKNVMVFSSGMSIPSKEGRQELINSNIIDLYHVRYYQLRGSFDMSKLPFFQRMMMKYTMNIMQSKQGVSNAMIKEMVERPFEYYDQEGVDKIINVASKLQNIVEVDEVK